MIRFLAAAQPRPDEVAAPMPGDEIVPRPDVVIDRAFTVPGRPQDVWPWFVQLGKRRAGWYLPRAVERLIPARRRGLRAINQRLQNLQVGAIIPDWGGRDATFEVAVLDPPGTLVHQSTRGRTSLTWAITLRPDPAGTRVQLRLRLQPVRRPWLARSVGDLFDLLTVAGLAAGLRERTGGARR